MTTKFPAPDMPTFEPLRGDIILVAERLEAIARTLREATDPDGASCKAARDIAVEARRALLGGPAGLVVAEMAARCETFEREKLDDDDEARRFLAKTTRLTAVPAAVPNE